MKAATEIAAAERRNTEARVTYALKILTLIILAAVILTGIVSFLLRVQAVAIILIGAIFFAYLLYPLVRLFEQRMPRGAAIGIVYLFVILLIGSFVAVIVPPLLENVKQFVTDFPKLLEQIKAAITDPHTPLLGRLAPGIRDFLANFSTQVGTYVETYGTQVASQTLTILLSTAGILATMIAIPVVAAYLLIDSEGMKRRFLMLIPITWRPKAQAISVDLEKVMGGFIRGQLIVAAIIGVAIAVMLTLFHVKYGLLIGITAGVLDLIPYVGAVVAFVPAVTIALFTGGAGHAAAVAIAFVVIFQLEGHFISPTIVSESVGLTPFMVIVAILIGAELGGIAGMFIAVPIAGMLRVLVLHAVPKEQQILEVAHAKGIIIPGDASSEGNV